MIDDHGLNVAAAVARQPMLMMTMTMRSVLQVVGRTTSPVQTAAVSPVVNDVTVTTTVGITATNSTAVCYRYVFHSLISVS